MRYENILGFMQDVLTLLTNRIRLQSTGNRPMKPSATTLSTVAGSAITALCNPSNKTRSSIDITSSGGWLQKHLQDFKQFQIGWQGNVIANVTLIPQNLAYATDTYRTYLT